MDVEFIEDYLKFNKLLIWPINPRHVIKLILNDVFLPNNIFNPENLRLFLLKDSLLWNMKIVLNSIGLVKYYSWKSMKGLLRWMIENGKIRDTEAKEIVMLYIAKERSCPSYLWSVEFLEELKDIINGDNETTELDVGDLLSEQTEPERNDEMKLKTKVNSNEKLESARELFPNTDFVEVKTKRYCCSVM